MATSVSIPKLGVSMSEGVLLEWLVEDGEEVSEGTALFTLETDKTQTDIEAPSGGTVKILVQADEDTSLAVGTVVAEIE